MKRQINCIWTFSIFNKVFLVIILILFYVINIFFVASSAKGLYDFGSFVASGELANEKKNPYSEESPFIFSIYFPIIDHKGIAPNLNPPISILFFEHLPSSSPEKSLVMWRWFSGLLFIVSFLLLHFYSPNAQKPEVAKRVFLFFCFAGLWHTIELGQIYIVMLLLTIISWILIKQEKMLLGGIVLGIIIAIKPNFILWAIVLFANRNFKAFLVSGITGFIISLIPVLRWGPKIYVQWLEASQKFTPDLLIFPGNNSLQGLFARFSVPQIGIFIGIILTIAMVVFIVKNKPANITINTIGIVLSLLVSPIAWTGYTLLVFPILFEEKLWKAYHWVAVCIFIIPFPVILKLFQLSNFNFVFFGWFYGWGLLVLLLGTLINKKDPLSV